MGGTFSRDSLNAERDRLNGLGCVNGLRVPDVQRGEYVAQLFGAHPGDFSGRENLEEVIMTQMEVIKKSATNVQVRFFLAPGCAPIQVGQPVAVLWPLSDAGSVRWFSLNR